MTSGLLWISILLLCSLIQAVDLSETTLEGTKASVWLLPSRAPLGSNYWEHDKGRTFWANDTLWATYLKSRDQDVHMLKYLLGDSPNATVIVQFQNYLADTKIWGPEPLGRLAEALIHFSSAHIAVILLLGDLEFYGEGTWDNTHDVVRNLTARTYLLDNFKRVLSQPNVTDSVSFISSYWLGGSEYCSTQPTHASCSTSDISDLIGALKDLSNGFDRAYLQHVDGPFWDGTEIIDTDSGGSEVDSPAVNGYCSQSLSVAQGVLAESWCQGSLLPGVQSLLATGAVTTSTLLLLNDVPNCDDPTQPQRCSTGSLTTDDSQWFDWLEQAGLQNTWGIWDLIDGGCDGQGHCDMNSYGDLTNDGHNLTNKGQLHRTQALKPWRQI